MSDDDYDKPPGPPWDPKDKASEWIRGFVCGVLSVLAWAAILVVIYKSLPL